MEIESETNSSSDVVLKCLNCEADLAGSFCHECGQSNTTQRYSIKRIGTEIYEQFRKIDALTTLRTFWQLTTKPGEFITSYLGGKRVGFLAPIKYFFYSFVVQVLVGGWLQWLINDRSLFETGHIDFRYEIAIFISTGFWGILWWLFYRGSELNVVENMVAALFFVGQCNFLALIFELITLPLVRAEFLSKDVAGILELSIHLAFSFYFARNLFRERYLLLIPKQFALSILYFILVILIFLGAFGIDAMMGQIKNLK